MSCLKYLSLFSGIEAAALAWKPLGWNCLGVSEIEPFPSAVLAHRFPGVKNFGDITKADYGSIKPDIIVGGSPCQSFSIAGLRKGLDDPRGNLALAYLRCIDRLRPRWFIWENVPGVLSSKGGKDFETFLLAVAEIGYGFSWRICDAQFFGVPQQRRRVFVIGYFGDWRPATAVLFEPASLRGDIATRGKTGENIAGTLEARASTGGYDQTVVCVTGSKTHALTADGFDASEDGTGRGQPLIYDMRGSGSGSVSPTLCTDHASRPSDKSPIVVMAHGQGGAEIMQDKMPALTCNHEAPIIVDTKQNKGRLAPKEKMSPMRSDGECEGIVRRITPIEAERLLGLPDNFTQIPWRGKSAELCPDGPRYKAIGNSMAVPVMHWIGRRIALFENLKEQGCL